MAQARKLGSRPDRAEDEAVASIAGEFADRLTGELARPLVERKGLGLQSELAERHRRAAKAVGLHNVGAGLEVADVDRAHDVGPRAIEDLGAVLVPEIIALDIEAHRLHAAAHRAVAQQHAIAKCVENGRHVARVRSGGIRVIADQRAAATAAAALSAAETGRMPRMWQIAYARSARFRV